MGINYYCGYNSEQLDITDEYLKKILELLHYMTIVKDIGLTK